MVKSYQFGIRGQMASSQAMEIIIISTTMALIRYVDFQHARYNILYDPLCSAEVQKRLTHVTPYIATIADWLATITAGWIHGLSLTTDKFICILGERGNSICLNELVFN